jgi:hypothetical protein
VVGSVDIGGTAGDEIAIQDNITGLIWISIPRPSGARHAHDGRHPGSEWKVVGIGS